MKKNPISKAKTALMNISQNFQLSRRSGFRDDVKRVMTYQMKYITQLARLFHSFKCGIRLLIVPFTPYLSREHADKLAAFSTPHSSKKKLQLTWFTVLFIWLTVLFITFFVFYSQFLTFICSCTSQESVFTTSGTLLEEHNGELRYISKYLVQYVPAAPAPKTKSSAAKRVSGARVLTRPKCAAILQEREDKKKKDKR